MTFEKSTFQWCKNMILVDDDGIGNYNTDGKVKGSGKNMKCYTKLLPPLRLHISCVEQKIMSCTTNQVQFRV